MRSRAVGLFSSAKGDLLILPLSDKISMSSISYQVGGYALAVREHRQGFLIIFIIAVAFIIFKKKATRYQTTRPFFLAYREKTAAAIAITSMV